MPSIVVTPKYNPFTFDELYRPLAETTKMQMALEDQYNAMDMEAAKLDYLKDSDKDAYAIVKNYEDTLRGLAGELASNGLTPQSRQGVYDMRKMYSSDVEPINKYIAWKDAQAKSRQAMRDKDSTYMWETPLEDVYYNTWRENPGITFRGASGETLSKDVAESVKYLQNKWTNDPIIEELSKKYPELKGMFRETEEYGISKEMLNKFLSTAPEEDKKKILGVYNNLLNYAINQVAEKHGLNSWKNSSDVESWKRASLENGLWAALGPQKDQSFNAPKEGTGSGSGNTVADKDSVEWERIALNIDPSFIPSFEDALYGQYSFENTVNSLLGVITSSLPTTVGFDGNFNEFLSTPFSQMGDKLTTTNTSSIVNSRMALKKLAPTMALTNIADSKWNTSERLKVLDVITSGITGGTGAYEEINKDIDDKYKKYIDEELKKGNSDVIREIEGNERDSSGSSYGHKVNVPAIVALAWELDKAGEDKDKINMIMDKYAAMPLDRFGQIEIIDKDKYKREYSEYEVGQQLGNNALGKIRSAYNALKSYKDEETHDLGLFNHFVDPFDSSLLSRMLKVSKTYSNDKGEMDTYNYVWDDKEKDFKVEKTGNTIDKKDIKDEDLVNVVFSGRGVLLKINDNDGSYYYIKAELTGGRKSAMQEQWKLLKDASERARKIMYKNLDEITPTDIADYYKYKDRMKDIAIEMKKQIVESYRETKSEPVKY